MNESDPIVDEVRRIRDAHAAKFNYDPKAIFQDIKERESRSGRKYVSFAEVKIEPKHGAESNQTLQPSAVFSWQLSRPCRLKLKELRRHSCMVGFRDQRAISTRTLKHGEYQGQTGPAGTPALCYFRGLELASRSHLRITTYDTKVAKFKRH